MLHGLYDFGLASGSVVYGGAALLITLGASAAGGVSFWVTVCLAGAGSALSAMCIADPVSHPKDQPCTFIGQWFIWVCTALLWAMVAASLAWPWLKPADLAGVAMVLGISRRASRAICNVEWKTRRSRTPGFFVPTDPFQMRH